MTLAVNVNPHRRVMECFVVIAKSPLGQARLKTDLSCSQSLRFLAPSPLRPCACVVHPVFEGPIVRSHALPPEADGPTSYIGFEEFDEDDVFELALAIRRKDDE